MNYWKMMGVAIIASLFVWSAEPPPTLVQQIKKVERSINRRESYPFILIHKPSLENSQKGDELSQQKNQERKLCSHFCLVCLSKNFPKQQS